MTDYTLWADRGDGAQQIYDVAKYLKKCAGGKVNVLGIGPSVGQNYGLHSGKGTVAVYMTNGVGIATPNDLEMGCRPGGYYQYERCIFVWPQWIGNKWMSDTQIIKHKIPGEWDWNRSQAYNVGGKTATEWFPNAKYVDLVSGKSPEDVAQRICNEAYVTANGNPGSNEGKGSSSESQYSGSLQGSSDSNVSPLLQGEMTFEELVGEICKGIDLMFLPKRNTVVVTDFSTILAEAKYLRDNNYSVVKDEDIHLWQLEEDSYELNIDQHGFYNTVYVYYKNGIVKETFEDFARTFGEISITYYDKKVDKKTAEMKAKAYLAAHVRDFEMTVEATVLTEPNIDLGDIVTLGNPKYNNLKTSQGGNPEFLFVKGVNTNWEGDGFITSDLELQFGPTSPNKKEVPEHGIWGGGSNSGKSNDKSSDISTSSGSTKFNKCGVSSDKKTICGIGKASAGGEFQKYGGNFYRSIFKNKCPLCNREGVLVWGIFWANGNFGYLPCKGTSEGGSGEGHIFCKACDADYSCVDGKEHSSPPRATLMRADSGPVKSSKEEALQLKQGTYSI